jgi:hypothetical protein
MTDSLQRECTLTYLHVEAISMQLRRMDGVGDGNRTHNVRSHSPVLCQLSYSHRNPTIIATGVESCQTRSMAAHRNARTSCRG